MCLAVPARVVELRADNCARVDVGGLDVEVRTDLVPEAAAGQYVIVHAGYAIAVMDEQEAEETLRLIEEAHAPRKLSEH